MTPLGPLPLEPFRYYRFGARTVHLDGCVEVEAAYYGAPPGWIGQRVHVQWNDLHVRLIAPQTGQLLREHLRAPRGWHRIHEADRSTEAPASTLALLGRAATAGAHISTVCQSIHAPQVRIPVHREHPFRFNVNAGSADAERDAPVALDLTRRKAPAAPTSSRIGNAAAECRPRSSARDRANNEAHMALS